MASLREEARRILDDAITGVAFLAIWKTGRTWHAESIYDVEYIEGRTFPGKVKEHWEISADAAAKLREIWMDDHHAILVNPYYDNLGPFEEMTLGSLIDGIRFQYEDVRADYSEIFLQTGDAVQIV